jgi:hypothetical protein
MTSIKELFSLLTVKQLRELAYKHNVEVIIKSPSTMLKAELVQSLTDHYSDLVGTDLIPIPQKPLKMNKEDIPTKFINIIKAPKKEQKLKDQKLLENMREQFKEQGIDFYKPELYKLKQQQKETQASKYRTKEKLDEAIEKRKIRAEKAKQARIAKKGQDKKEEKKELTPGEKLAESLKAILKRAQELRTMNEGTKGTKLYSEVMSMKDNIQDKAKIMKKEGTLKKKEDDAINDEIDNINEILDDDDVYEKFYQE